MRLMPKAFKEFYKIFFQGFVKDFFSRSTKAIIVYFLMRSTVGDDKNTSTNSYKRGFFSYKITSRINRAVTSICLNNFLKDYICGFCKEFFQRP